MASSAGHDMRRPRFNFNPFYCNMKYTELVHWTFVGGLLHLVQQGRLGALLNCIKISRPKGYVYNSSYCWLLVHCYKHLSQLNVKE